MMSLKAFRIGEGSFALALKKLHCSLTIRMSRMADTELSCVRQAYLYLKYVQGVRALEPHYEAFIRYLTYVPLF